MKQWVLNNRRSILMTLAIYQVVGGVIGLLLVYSLFNPDAGAGFWLALTPIMVLIIISICAGMFYFFKGECGKFFLLSKLNFCAQIPQFALAGIKFLFYYGFYVKVGADSEYHFSLLFGFDLVKFAMVFGNFDLQFFNINLFPLLPLIMLRWAERNPVKEYADAFLTEDEPVNQDEHVH